MWKIQSFFSYSKMFISVRNAQITFAEKAQMKNRTTLISKSYWIRQSFVVNRALPSLQGVSLEITLTIPLRIKFWTVCCCWVTITVLKCLNWTCLYFWLLEGSGLNWAQAWTESGFRSKLFIWSMFKLDRNLIR